MMIKTDERASDMKNSLIDWERTKKHLTEEIDQMESECKPKVREKHASFFSEYRKLLNMDYNGTHECFEALLTLKQMKISFEIETNDRKRLLADAQESVRCALMLAGPDGA